MTHRPRWRCWWPIGTHLLEWAEERERALGRSEHRQWIASGNESGKKLLQAAGYELARSYWRMALTLTDLRTDTDTAPGDVRLRSHDTYERPVMQASSSGRSGFRLAAAGLP